MCVWTKIKKTLISKILSLNPYYINRRLYNDIETNCVNFPEKQNLEKTLRKRDERKETKKDTTSGGFRQKLQEWQALVFIQLPVSPWCMAFIIIIMAIQPT